MDHRAPHSLPEGQSEPHDATLVESGFAHTTITALAADMLPDNKKWRLIVAGIAVALALLSFFALGAWASSPETYASTIASLDAKRDTVMGLVGGSTGTSAAITLLPGDAGTPIAEKLLDIGADFAIVVGAIYLEKYMLTVLGFAAFKVLVPLACLLVAAAALLYGRGMRFRTVLMNGAVKLAVFGIAIALVVPASVLVSDMIDATHKSSVDATIAAAEQAATAAEEATPEEGEEAAEAQNGGMAGIVEFVQSIPSGVASAAESATAQAQATLNSFIETLAVMIVTSCVIPILVLLFFLWLVKTILGINVNVPLQAFTPRTFKGLKH